MIGLLYQTDIGREAYSIWEKKILPYIVLLEQCCNVTAIH